MRALVLDRSLKFRPDYHKPEPREGECLVAMRMAGICGTDLELAKGYMSFRGVPGHEFVGEVVTLQSALFGKRVVGEINVACGKCPRCKAGLGRHCATRTVLGIVGRDGAFADYLCLPEGNLHRVAEWIPDEVAVFAEPIAAAYEIFEQVRLERNQSIAVLGDGRLGAIVALTMAAEGFSPVVGGHHSEKLQTLAGAGMATALESELEPGFEVVVDCTGSSAGLKRALELVAPRGTIILKSTGAEAAALNLAAAVVNEISIVGSRCGRFAPALAALESGKIDPRPLISALMPLEEGVRGFALAGQPSTFKVILKAAA